MTEYSRAKYFNDNKKLCNVYCVKNDDGTLIFYDAVYEIILINQPIENKSLADAIRNLTESAYDNVKYIKGVEYINSYIFEADKLQKPITNLSEIRLKAITASTGCANSIIEQQIKTLYFNQEQILSAIKLLGSKLDKLNNNSD